MTPGWILTTGTRLDLDEFSNEFATAWNGLASRFLKLECWQTYQEKESNESLAAYHAGDLVAARGLLQKEAEEDRPLYEDIVERGIDYVRIRLVQTPLTPYLNYETLSYRIRVDMGEHIELVHVPGDVALPNEESFDFLVFDDSIALVHDYGTDGFQVGGWAVRDREAIESLRDRATALRRDSVNLSEFLSGQTG